MSSHLSRIVRDNCELIEAVASVLVEPAAGLPGAAELGIVPRVEAVLGTYPRFADSVLEALAELARGDGVRASSHVPGPTANATPVARALADLERDRPDLFTALLEVIVSAWALSEPVWDALGYKGQRDLDPAAHPIPEDLFQPLLARGPRWRQPPEVSQ